MKMAANSTTEKTASTSAARKITTYDLVIGILAIFSLIILIPLIFAKLPPSDAAVLNTLELRHIFTRRLAQSTLLFTLVVALLLVFTISWGVLLAEQHAPHANILTYHQAVWWAFVTITTVGYGDYYPVTPVGQFLAVILMFFGLGIIGVLSSYLATTFISLQRRRSERREGENEKDEDDDDDDSSSRDAELAAIREELAALRKLFEERYQAR
ncbi:MAG: two pore domain potassium channel family protein [Chloroflexi bacterium]|nr:MAG: two pore domain potassium channel family protein [Chloroflexota bacterium]